MTTPDGGMDWVDGLIIYIAFIAYFGTIFTILGWCESKARHPKKA